MFRSKHASLRCSGCGTVVFGFWQAARRPIIAGDEGSGNDPGDHFPEDRAGRV